MAVKREQVVQTAEKYVARGKIEPAIREYRKLLEENPNDINTLNRVGDLYARIQRIDEAVDFFNQIAEQYAGEGFFVKAIAIYKKIIKLDPTRLDVYESLAELYHRQGLVTEARTQYQVLADYYQKHENATSTIAIYLKMAQLEPNNPTYHVKLAELYQQQQLIEKAMGEYRIIAELMIAHGHPQEAAQVYERALAIDSTNIAFISSAAQKLKEAAGTGVAARFLAAAVERNPQAAQVARLIGAGMGGTLSGTGPGTGSHAGIAAAGIAAPAAATPGPAATAAGAPAARGVRGTAAAPASRPPAAAAMPAAASAPVAPPAVSAPMAPVAPPAPAARPPAAPAVPPARPESAPTAAASAAVPAVRPAPPAAPAGQPVPPLAATPAPPADVDLDMEIEIDLEADLMGDGGVTPLTAPGGEEDRQPERFGLAAGFDPAFEVEEDQAAPPRAASPPVTPEVGDEAAEDIFVLDIEDDEEPASLVKPPPDMLREPRRPAWARDAGPQPAAKAPAPAAERGAPGAQAAMPAAAPPLPGAAPPPGPAAVGLAAAASAAPGPAGPQATVSPAERLPQLRLTGEFELINPFAALLQPAAAAAAPPSSAATEAPPRGDAAAPAPGAIDSGLIERAGVPPAPSPPAAVEPPQPSVDERYEDLVSEAEVLAKYGLEEKAIERLREAVRIKPRPIAALMLLAQLQLDKGRHARVVELANQVARLSGSGDREPWAKLRKRLLGAGYRIEGNRVTGAPQLPGALRKTGRVPLLRPAAEVAPAPAPAPAAEPAVPSVPPSEAEAAGPPSVAAPEVAAAPPPAGPPSPIPASAAATPSIAPAGPESPGASPAPPLAAAPSVLPPPVAGPPSAPPPPDAAAPSAPPPVAAPPSAPPPAVAESPVPPAAAPARRPRKRVEPSLEKVLEELVSRTARGGRAARRPAAVASPPAAAVEPRAEAAAPAPAAAPAAPASTGALSAAAPSVAPSPAAAPSPTAAPAPADASAPAVPGPSVAAAAPAPPPPAATAAPPAVETPAEADLIELPPLIGAGEAPPPDELLPPEEVFNPLEIGAMVESVEIEWSAPPAAGNAQGTAPRAAAPQAAAASPLPSSPPSAPPLSATPPPAPPPASAAGALDDTGGMSWLDEAESGKHRVAARGASLFDEEEDFFDLAGELEHELAKEPAFQGEDLLVQPEQSLEEIVEGFKRGVSEHLSPTDYDTHYNLGIAYREMELLDEAIGEFQLSAKDPHYLVSCCSMLGLCFLDKGLPELAIKWYRRGLEAETVTEDDTLGLLYDMGCAYLAMGDKEGAYKSFVDAYGINTNYRDLVARIEELGRRH
jgi:tetratricopeptide (TPR) repeat protein